MNPYQANIQRVLDVGQRINTRTGTTLFKSPTSTFFNQRDLHWIKTHAVDKNTMSNLMHQFKSGTASDINAEWLINTNTIGYGTHIYNEGWLDFCIDLLKKDSTSRQACIYIPGDFKSGYLPCWTSFAFVVSNSFVNMTAHARSCDLIKGFPYDITLFNSMLKDVAHALDVSAGYATVTITNPHIYETDIALAQQLIAKEEK